MGLKIKEMGTEKIKQEEITYSMFKDAYKQGLISKNRLNYIRGKFKNLERLEGIRDKEGRESLSRPINGMRYRLLKNYEDIYKVEHKEPPLKDKKILTAKESVQYSVENGFKLSTTTLYKLANEGVIEKHISELGVIGFKPDDVIRICNGRADKHNKPLLSLKKYSDDDLIRELENRKRFKD